MKLYEINEEILHLMNRMEVDEETGEVPADMDEILAELDSLQMEKKSVLEYIAKLVINTRAESAMLKEEETRLKSRRDALARKEDRLIFVLDRECDGVKTDLGVATLSYRKTSRVEVADPRQAVAWLKENDHANCYRTPEPEISKTEVKKLLNNGVEVPGCSIIEDRNCSLR